MNSYSDKQLIDGLLSGDNYITRFFFVRVCGNMLRVLSWRIFDNAVPIEELMSELYILISENDWRRLRMFKYRSKLTTYVYRTAYRHFLHIKPRLIGKEELPTQIIKEPSVESDNSAKIDMGTLLSQLTNERYAFVINEEVINGSEPEEIAKKLNVTLANYYNIKKRAIAALTQILDNDIKIYGRKV